jgi:hypothetical protein
MLSPPPGTVLLSAFPVHEIGSRLLATPPPRANSLPDPRTPATHHAHPQEDDRDIQAEGLESLDDDELRAACRARGMRTPYGEGAAAFMRDQLAEWLDWSLNR